MEGHVPPALFGLALAVLLVSLARPVARLTLPWSSSTIMLAIDVSLSMRVRDVKPTRMVAAQEAARAFLQEVPPNIQVGIVTFAGSAQVAQQATIDRPSLIGAIDRIQMQRGTAIGSAIVLCLAELIPDHGLDLGEMTLGPSRRKTASKPFTPVAPGSYESAAIILLSGGRRTTGVDTLQAAKMAADRGVRVYVVGLGTPDGHLAEVKVNMMHLAQAIAPHQYPALGIIEGREQSKEDFKVIAVIGDGAMTAGLALEGLNNAGDLKKDLIVILNDNEMSISPNVGALSAYLNRILTGERYQKFKKETRSFLESIPKLGNKAAKIAQKTEEMLKGFFLPGILFEELGFNYVGPIEGHNIELLIHTLMRSKTSL